MIEHLPNVLVQPFPSHASNGTCDLPAVSEIEQLGQGGFVLHIENMGDPFDQTVDLEHRASRHKQVCHIYADHTSTDHVCGRDGCGEAMGGEDPTDAPGVDIPSVLVFSGTDSNFNPARTGLQGLFRKDRFDFMPLPTRLSIFRKTGGIGVLFLLYVIRMGMFLRNLFSGFPTAT